MRWPMTETGLPVNCMWVCAFCTCAKDAQRGKVGRGPIGKRPMGRQREIRRGRSIVGELRLLSIVVHVLHSDQLPDGSEVNVYQ